MRSVFLRKAIDTVFVAIFATIASAVLVPSTTETAAANGDTRTLHLYHTHTFETIDATYRVDGHYNPTVLRQLNHFLRDWRNNDEISMDPRLFDAVWEAYRSAGATQRIEIYSAYRSPATNAMLRRRSRAVAEHSQHMLGRAMDTTMPGFPMERVREAGLKLQNGGVGWYPSANFVHLDVGSVRSWPRMPYQQLARLFPDGKTVHIAASGQTLPGYEAARMELAARGSAEVPPAQESGGFFAWLFGGGNTAGAAREDEEDRRTAVARRQAPPVAPVAQQEPAPIQQAALAYTGSQAGAAQPLDTIPRVTPGSQPERQQVASLEAKVDDRSSDPGAVMPLPPRRPAEMEAAADIPLPPIRPEALVRVQSASVRFSSDINRKSDPIAGLIMATASGVPMIRKSGLPALITQGGKGHKRLPSRILSFAALDAASDADRGDLPSDGAARGLEPFPARAASHKRPFRSLPVARPIAPALAGPKLTGLRRAAHALEKESL